MSIFSIFVIMHEVINIKDLGNYHLWIKFKDGQEKVINFRPFIGKGFTKELLDPESFKGVTIEPGGAMNRQPQPPSSSGATLW